MILTVKQLRKTLETYEDDMNVLIFVGKNGKQRRITTSMEVVDCDGETVRGIALEVEN